MRSTATACPPCCSCLAQAPQPRRTRRSREHLAPQGWEGSYHRIHYTPVLKIGDRVIVSGIPAIEGETDEDKIRWLFQQLRRTWNRRRDAGGRGRAAQLPRRRRTTPSSARGSSRCSRCIAEFFKDRYPAWTAVGTTALFSPKARRWNCARRRSSGRARAPRRRHSRSPDAPSSEDRRAAGRDHRAQGSRHARAAPTASIARDARRAAAPAAAACRVAPVVITSSTSTTCAGSAARRAHREGVRAGCGVARAALSSDCGAVARTRMQQVVAQRQVERARQRPGQFQRLVVAAAAQAGAVQRHGTSASGRGRAGEGFGHQLRQQGRQPGRDGT